LGNGHVPCIEVPELTRLRYFYGQMLGPADFQAEQDYFREKLKLHNRCLHGYGVVCGLDVVPEPAPEDCAPVATAERPKIEQRLRDLEQRRQQEEQRGASTHDLDVAIAELRRRLDCLPETDGETPPTCVRIECGLAYDCDGNELVVRRALSVELPAAARTTTVRPAGTRSGLLYISLCYCEQPVGPVRPVLSEACGAMASCTFGKLRDAVRILVSPEPPADDTRCEACCDGCENACVLLARIDDVVPGGAVLPEQIHNEVRRSLAPYALTRITGISWTHGATYTDDEASDLLGRQSGTGRGLEIRFSRAVLTATITPGVIDVWVIEGGGGRHAYMYNMDVELDAGTARTTDRIWLRQTSGERFDDGDRVLVQLRATFILDLCCYGVDGENVGGRVPLLADYDRFRRGEGDMECLTPRRGSSAWASGNGVQAGSFESWFYIGSGDSDGPRRARPREGT
jgi:hypothetical protein